MTYGLLEKGRESGLDSMLFGGLRWEVSPLVKNTSHTGLQNCTEDRKEFESTVKISLTFVFIHKML